MAFSVVLGSAKVDLDGVPFRVLSGRAEDVSKELQAAEKHLAKLAGYDIKLGHDALPTLPTKLDALVTISMFVCRYICSPRGRVSERVGEMTTNAITFSYDDSPSIMGE